MEPLQAGAATAAGFGRARTELPDIAHRQQMWQGRQPATNAPPTVIRTPPGKRRTPSHGRTDRERTAYVRDAEVIRHVSDLETSVVTWLQPHAGGVAGRDRKTVPGQLPPHTSLCVISGGPGSGKSSFCKKLAARLVAEGRHVLLIPMHHFTLNGGIPASVDSCVEGLRLMNHSPLQNRRALVSQPVAQAPLVLIFDGLDELANQGRASQEAARLSQRPQRFPAR